MMTVRSPKVMLFYAGTEITGDVSGSLISFRFVDQAYDQGDTIEVTLDNRSQVWNNGWMPQIGGVMAAIVQYEGEGLSVPLICGAFSVDDVECSAPPDIVQIRAVSAAIDTALRNEKNSKGYEQTSLKKIAEDVAKKHGLQLFWDADDVEVKRLDQRQQSDLAFLKDLCAKYGIKVKAADGKLICRGIKQMDVQVPTLIIARGNSDLISFQLRHQSHNIFKSSEVSYCDPEDRKNKKYKFEPVRQDIVDAAQAVMAAGGVTGGGKPKVSEIEKIVGRDITSAERDQAFAQVDRGMNGSELKINERVESEDQARKRAEGELREKNKDQTEGTITLMGNTLIYAGTTALLTGFGLKFDGLWLIREARHSVGRAGYTTGISIRKTLGW